MGGKNCWQSCEKCSWRDLCGGECNAACFEAFWVRGEPPQDGSPFPLYPHFGFCRGEDGVGIPGYCKCCLVMCPRRFDFPERVERVGGLDFSPRPGDTPLDMDPQGVLDTLPDILLRVKKRALSYAGLELGEVGGWVTLPLYELVGRRGKPCGIYTRWGSIQGGLGLEAGTKVLLSGFCHDDVLEQFWSRLVQDPHGVLRELSALGVTACVVPFFSILIDAPRAEHLYNYRRWTWFAERCVEVGMPVVPLLTWFLPRDAERLLEWVDFHRPPWLAVNYQVHGDLARGKRLARTVWILSRLGYTPNLIITGWTYGSPALVAELFGLLDGVVGRVVLVDNSSASAWENYQALRFVENGERGGKLMRQKIGETPRTLDVLRANMAAVRAAVSRGLSWESPPRLI